MFERLPRPRAESIPALVSCLGGLLFVSLVAQWFAFDGFRLNALLGDEQLVHLLVNGVPALGVAVGGRRLGRSDLDAARYPRVAKWCLGGLAGFLGINLVLIAYFPAPTVEANLGWAHGTAVFGAAGGLLVGIIEARAIHREIAAERAVLRADDVEERRQWFDYLNSLLRHEVLNTVNVIDGYAQLIAEDVPAGSTREYAATIRRQGRDMAGVVRDVRVLIAATEGTTEFESVDLVAILTAELTDLRVTYDDVEISTSFEPDVFVRADELLPRVFSNLFTNAVKHNEGNVPRIRVSVATRDGTAVVDIADDGPGVPESKRPDLFERGNSGRSDHGLGLYLVRTLVERYGGSIELAETGPDGSVFTVELPRASTPPLEGPGSSRAVDRTDDASRATADS